MNRTLIYTLIFLLAFTSAIYLKSTLYLDPDLGWELKTGEHILTQGFPRTDPFSYTMPDFPIVLHSWLSEVIFFQVFQHFGLSGLALLTSIALTATVVVIFGLSWQSWVYVPALLISAHFLPYAGTRPQTFSWLFFAILLRVLFYEKTREKYKLFLPLLFLVWAQFHGGFLIGLVVLGMFAVLKPKTYLYIAACSILVTLINPYGLSLWREVISTITSVSLHASVNEWSPIISRLDIRLGLNIVLPLFFISRFWGKYAVFDKAVFVFLTLLMLSASKLFPFWLITTGYIMSSGFEYALDKISTIPSATRRFSLLVYGVGVAVIINSIVLTAATVQTYKPLSENSYYPKKAVAYLQANPPQGNIFAPFGWGGYLIWKLPEKKVFISGQMPHWGSILSDYIRIIKLESPFEEVAQSYNISTVLVQKSKTNFDNLATHLEKNGWKVVYEDANTKILETRPF